MVKWYVYSISHVATGLYQKYSFALLVLGTSQSMCINIFDLDIVKRTNQMLLISKLIHALSIAPKGMWGFMTHTLLGNMQNLVLSNGPNTRQNSRICWWTFYRKIKYWWSNLAFFWHLICSGLLLLKCKQT